MYPDASGRNAFLDESQDEVHFEMWLTVACLERGLLIVHWKGEGRVPHW